MISLKEHFILGAVGAAAASHAASRPLRVLDLGCGDAAYVPTLLSKFPDLSYVGVEPIVASYEKAAALVGTLPNVTLHHRLGYDDIPGETDGSCDLVFSLSVLEHIKQLDRFIALSARYVAPGGTLVHRYDLGHALHPCSLKERLHVWVGNTLPQVLPERQFVRYVPEPTVRESFSRHGVRPTKTTYHQLRSHKLLEKHFKNSNSVIVDELYAWEERFQNDILTIPVTERERLFPAVAVWGVKE